MIDKEFGVKIGDFGSAKFLLKGSKNSTHIVTSNY